MTSVKPLDREPDQDVAALAREAVREMNRLLPGMTGFARALTGNKDVQVTTTSGASYTDGRVIFMHPPIELGLTREHTRSLCSKRDSRSVQLCYACKSHEDVMVTLYHEVAHLAYGSFDEISDQDRHELLDRALAEASATGVLDARTSARIERRIATNQPSSYIQAAGLVSPYLPMMLNALEDARVNLLTHLAAPGTVAMFRGQANEIFDAGMTAPDGTVMHWRDAKPNAQVLIGLYVKASRLDYSGWFQPEIEAVLDDPEITELMNSFDSSSSAADIFRLCFPVLECLRKHGFCGGKKQQEEPANSGDEDDESSEDENDEDARPENEDESSSDQGDENDEDAQPDDEGNSPSGDPGKGGKSGSEGNSPSGHSVPEDEDENGSDESGEGGGQDAPTEDENGSDESGEQDAPSDDDDESGEGGEQDAPSDDDDESGEGGEQDAPSDDDDESGEGGEQDAPSDDDDESGEGGGDDSAGITGGSWLTNHSSGETADDLSSDDDVAEDEESGTADDAKDALDSFTGHDGGRVNNPGGAGDFGDMGIGGVSEDELNLEIERAISQIEHFDSPSRRIAGLAVRRSPDDLFKHSGWVYGFASDELMGSLSYNYVACDKYALDLELPSETVLGPALLELRKTFSENARTRHTPDLKSGRVDTRVLGRRVPTQDPRLFRRQDVPGKRDYFVLIGLDISGSTEGENIRILKQAAFAKAELLARLGVKFAVYAHTGQNWYVRDENGDVAYDADRSPMHLGLGVEIMQVKAANQPWDASAKARLASLLPGGGNVDGHTIEFYRKVVERERATDKIILYYNDGAMPSANKNEELEIIRREIAHCKRHGISLVGVGIRSEDPKKFGLDTIRLDEVEDVPKVVTELRKRLGG